MFFKKENKQNRKGMNLYAIIGGIALAAILGLVVAPRLASAELPGFRSNMQSDINSMQELLQSYAANHQGSYQDLFTLKTGQTVAGAFQTLVSEGIMTGAMEDGVTLTIANAPYRPSWAEDGVEINIGPVTGNFGVVNIFITTGNNANTQEFVTQLETTVLDFASSKFGSANVAATALSTAVVAAPAANTVADATYTESTNTVANDGIEFTIR